jgi:hypothetical protein
MRFRNWTSLRKRMRAKKSGRSKKSARVTPFARAVGVGAIALVVMGGAIVAITASGSHPSVPAHPRIAEAAPAQLPATQTELPKIPLPGDPGTDSIGSDRKSPMVTITGCLEREAETFRLKDTSGSDAPKARTWKSGFLKKSAAPVEVVDGGNKAKLPSHVGQRVSVTGVLVDREMQLRSLQRVAPSCSKTPRA